MFFLKAFAEGELTVVQGKLFQWFMILMIKKKMISNGLRSMGLVEFVIVPTCQTSCLKLE